jgi:hypothetical protein
MHYWFQELLQAESQTTTKPKLQYTKNEGPLRATLNCSPDNVTKAKISQLAKSTVIERD